MSIKAFLHIVKGWIEIIVVFSDPMQHIVSVYNWEKSVKWNKSVKRPWMQQEHLEPASQLIAPLLKGEWHPIHFFHCPHILDMPATQDFVIISSLSGRKYWWPHHCGPWCSECVSNLVRSGRSENKPILIQHHPSTACVPNPVGLKISEFWPNTIAGDCRST